MSNRTRPSWSNDLGFLFAAVGSAIGLGSIWRFAYKCHEHGGGVFLVPYIFALVVVGIPLMLLEYGLGHRERAASPLSFRRIGKGWEWIGWFMPIVGLFAIMLYYSVVIGWCVSYLVYSIDLKWLSSGPETFFFKEYLQVSSSPFDLGGVRWPVLASTLSVWLICWVILYRGISKGIEKACMLFMPLLFLLTIGLAIWIMPLNGAWEAIREQYLHLDWSKINPFTTDPGTRWGALRVWGDSFGQVFFTMSLGFGIMIAYASYLPHKSDLVVNSILTNAIDTIYSLMAGVVVFGVIGFMATSQGVAFNDAIKSGPQLAFVAFPKAIENIPVFRGLFGMTFFLVCVIAGTASGVSLIETFVCSITDKIPMKRERLVTALCLLGFVGSVLFTTRAGLPILDILDNFANKFALVFGGFVECIIVGWVVGSRTMRLHIEETAGRKVTVFWEISIKYVSPIILGAILVTSVIETIRNGYGGYPTSALLIFGVLWLGLCAVAAIVLAVWPWKPEQLERRRWTSEGEPSIPSMSAPSTPPATTTPGSQEPIY
jgi:NSS family neurotransmitter:Na+ symporter